MFSIFILQTQPETTINGCLGKCEYLSMVSTSVLMIALSAENTEAPHSSVPRQPRSAIGSIMLEMWAGFSINNASHLHFHCTENQGSKDYESKI